MEVSVISEFLVEHHWPNHIDRRLRPARIILDCLNDVQVGICIPDGCLVLEDLTRVCNPQGYRPLAVIDLANPDSLDELLKAVEAIVSNTDNILWAPDPLVRAVQQTLIEAGYDVRLYDGSDGLYLPSVIADRKGDDFALYLKFKGPAVELRQVTPLLSYHFDLADPESLDAIVNRVDTIRQRYRRDAGGRLTLGGKRL